MENFSRTSSVFFRFYILCENFSKIGPIIKKIPKFSDDPLKGTTWFQAPKMAKKIIFFFLLERSPRTVLQLIPKHWGSAANRNPPPRWSNGCGVWVNKIYFRYYLSDFLKIWNVYVKSNSKNFFVLTYFSIFIIEN